jgi:hypothetical protein
MPKNGFLSRRTREPPRSRTVCAAERPARPPPTMITRSPDCADMKSRSILNFSSSKLLLRVTEPRLASLDCAFCTSGFHYWF